MSEIKVTWNITLQQHLIELSSYSFFSNLVFIFCKAIMSGEVNQRFVKDELKSLQSYFANHSFYESLSTMWKLGLLIWSQRQNVNLLLDVHGYQIFSNGKFNGGTFRQNV